MSRPKRFREILTVAYQRFNALERGEKRCFGVSMSQCVALETLRREGPVPVRELSDRIGLDTSTVTRLVDGLVRDGLARRARDEGGDRRRVFVSLTDAGRELAGRLEACADEAQRGDYELAAGVLDGENLRVIEGLVSHILVDELKRERVFFHASGGPAATGR